MSDRSQARIVHYPLHYRYALSILKFGAILHVCYSKRENGYKNNFVFQCKGLNSGFWVLGDEASEQRDDHRLLTVLQLFPTHKKSTATALRYRGSISTPLQVSAISIWLLHLHFVALLQKFIMIILIFKQL